MRLLALLMSIFLALPCRAETFDHQPTTDALAADLASGDPVKIAIRTDAALFMLITEAAIQLRRVGDISTAERITYEFEREFKGYYQLLVMAKGLGDHRPLSIWLANLYDELESKLGPRIMELFHLDDIKVFNFATPVVFGMKDFLGESIDFTEFDIPHWRPFCGVVAYWTTWAVCTGLTWGAGAITLICSPAGMLAEIVTVRYIAPPLADEAYELFWLRECYCR